MDESRPKFRRIDENVYTDEEGRVHEKRGEQYVPTGAKVEGAIAPREAEAALVPKFSPEAMETSFENFRLLSEIMKSKMKRGHHYGKFPGWQKDQLLEPGSSLIMNGFALYADPIHVDRTEDEEGHFRYNVIVHLCPIGAPNRVVAAGVGNASTREIKYAYRWVDESEVPNGLDRNELLMKTAGSRVLYRVPNEDPGDLENTIEKMAMKRAEIDAVNHLPGVSELFPPPGAETKAA